MHDMTVSRITLGLGLQVVLPYDEVLCTARMCDGSRQQHIAVLGFTGDKSPTRRLGRLACLIIGALD